MRFNSQWGASEGIGYQLWILLCFSLTLKILKKDMRLLLEWVSTALTSFLMPLRLYIEEKKIFKYAERNMEQIISKQRLTPFALNTSPTWTPAHEQLLTVIWLLFFFKHQTPNVSLSVLTLMILSVTHTYSPSLRFLLFHTDKKEKDSQHLVEVWRN